VRVEGTVRGKFDHEKPRRRVSRGPGGPARLAGGWTSFAAPPSGAVRDPPTGPGMPVDVTPHVDPTVLPHPAHLPPLAIRSAAGAPAPGVRLCAAVVTARWRPSNIGVSHPPPLTVCPPPPAHHTTTGWQCSDHVAAGQSVGRCQNRLANRTSRRSEIGR